MAESIKQEALLEPWLAEDATVAQFDRQQLAEPMFFPGSTTCAMPLRMQIKILASRPFSAVLSQRAPRSILTKEPTPPLQPRRERRAFMGDDPGAQQVLRMLMSSTTSSTSDAAQSGKLQGRARLASPAGELVLPGNFRCRLLDAGVYRARLDIELGEVRQDLDLIPDRHALPCRMGERHRTAT
ncbi:hypothetical protein ACU8OG_08680 [Rhizobium leguminosarum]